MIALIVLLHIGNPNFFFVVFSLDLLLMVLCYDFWLLVGVLIVDCFYVEMLKTNV